ncbi:glutamine synthetase family protein [Pseudonocardia sp.]|uniref:glutamine synthetase family protein n=1 Tax=Pseudonocardia sp. TaxID=60912 RepID=UPI003D0B4B03
MTSTSTPDPTPRALPVLDQDAITAVEERLAVHDVQLLCGTVVDPAGVIRAKAVPVARTGAFHVGGMGASPSWNVFCTDNAIAFRPGFGVVGDLRLRADLTALRVLEGGLAWAPTEMTTQDGTPAPVCTRGLLRRAQAGLEERGIVARVGAELEFVVTERVGHPWNAYGLGPLLDLEAFVQELLAALAAAGLPVEQVHAEYGAGQLELSLPPADPLAAADGVVLARTLAGRVARRHDLAVSFSPLPFADGAGNGAHLHLSLHRDDRPLFSGGDGPHGLTREGGAAIGGIVAGLADLIGVFSGSVLSPHRLQPGYWSGAFACWGLENREAAVRLCAATPGNPHGASVELKCIDPSANPYLAAAALLGLAADGVDRGLPLPQEVAVNPAEVPGTARLPAGQAAVLAALEASPLAERLLGPDIRTALLAVRHHERETYGDADVAGVAERFRFTWSV